MIETVFYLPWEVSLQIFIQSYVNGFVLEFFRVSSDLLASRSVFIFCALIYWVYDKELGKLSAIALACTNIVTGFLKSMFARVRPYVANPEIKGLHPPTPGESMYDSSIMFTSFPSGHVSANTAIWSEIVLYIRNRYALILAVVVTLIVAIARIGLGVHYPTDVMAAFVEAIIISVAVYYLFTKIENRTMVYIGLIIVSIIIMVLYNNSSIFSAGGAMIGVCCGFLVEEKYINFEVKRTWASAIVKIALGVIIYMAMTFIVKNYLGDFGIISKIIKLGLVNFILFGLYPFAFEKMDEII